VKVLSSHKFNNISAFKNQHSNPIVLEALDAAGQIFSLTNEEKLGIRMHFGLNRGWDNFYEESLDDGLSSEGFVYGRENIDKMSNSNNIWPDSIPESARHALLKFLDFADYHGRQIILNMIGLKINSEDIDDLRVKIAYYSVKGSSQMTPIILCDEHVDYGVATFNVSSVSGWLQGRSNSTDEWITLEARQFEPMVWLGSQATTINSDFKSLIHRVRWPSQCKVHTRISLSVFFDLHRNEELRKTNENGSRLKTPGAKNEPY